jgi:hypothetical protein
LCTAVHFYYGSPRGAFLDPYIDPETFWVFQDGKMYLTSGNGLVYAGVYSKWRGKWVIDKGYVEASFFGLRWFDSQFNNGGVHFLPRRCFKWFYYNRGMITWSNDRGDAG